MMFGGGMMIGVGLLMMLLVFGLPTLLVIALVGGAAGFLQKQNRSVIVGQKPLPVDNQVVRPDQPVPAPSRYCTHCGGGLQADWTHCPQCGAPIN